MRRPKGIPGLKIEVWEGGTKRVEYSFEGWAATHEPRFAKVGQPAEGLVSDHSAVFVGNGTGRTNVTGVVDNLGNLNIKFSSSGNNSSVILLPPTNQLDEIDEPSDTEWEYSDGAEIYYTQSAHLLTGNGWRTGVFELIIYGEGAGEEGPIRIQTLVKAGANSGTDSEVRIRLISGDNTVVFVNYARAFTLVPDVSIDITVKLIPLPPSA